MNRAELEGIELSLVETKKLLDRAKAAGLLVKEIAEILGITPQQVSTYRRSPMPLNNRRVLAAHLDNMERTVTPIGGYPSQQTSTEHDNVERLSRLTGAQGPMWRMYQELALSILKMAEEAQHAREARPQEEQRSEGGEDAQGH